MTSTTLVSDIEAALLQALPRDMHGIVPQFAQALARAASGNAPAEATALAAEFTPLLRALEGTEIKTEHKVLSFGKDNEFGSVTVGDVAGGHIVKPIFFYSTPHGLRHPRNPKHVCYSTFARPRRSHPLLGGDHSGKNPPVASNPSAGYAGRLGRRWRQDHTGTNS